MFSLKNIVQRLLLIVPAVFVVIVWLFLLTGCLGLGGKQEHRDQSLSISADCDENTINVVVDDFQDDDTTEISVAK